ncbi:NUDIX domain-containing protein [Mycoplasma hafezii]|uniref:NUDIX domain-containing protein n=1 Tax=Mycoplasma hafezii TaxID=525886 RepID=UPI003CF07762
MALEISCGCIVFKEFQKQTKVLLIKQKNGYWTFPKGHQEGNETFLETAKRELLEETSIPSDQYLEIIDSKTYDNQYVLANGNNKEVHFFLAKYYGSLNPKRQISEVDKIGFFPLTRAMNLITYPTNKKQLQEAYRDYQIWQTKTRN